MAILQINTIPPPSTSNMWCVMMTSLTSVSWPPIESSPAALDTCPWPQCTPHIRTWALCTGSSRCICNERGGIQRLLPLNRNISQHLQSIPNWEWLQSKLQVAAHVIVAIAITLTRSVLPNFTSILGRAVTAQQWIWLQIHLTVLQAHLPIHALAFRVILKGSLLVRLQVAAHGRHNKVQIYRLLVLHYTQLIVKVTAPRVRPASMQNGAVRSIGFARIRRHCNYLGLGPPALCFSVHAAFVQKGQIWGWGRE